MASIYRRKQDAILGLDNSSFVTTSDSLANAVARYRGDAEGREKVQPIINHSESYYLPDSHLEQAEEDAVSRMESSRDYARSMYDHNSNNDDEYEVSDLEDSDMEEPKRTITRPSKADQLLGIGQPSLRSKQDERQGPGISSKAQRILGMSKALKAPHTSSLQRSYTLPSVSTDSESIAPKAMRTLGIQTNSPSRMNSKHRPLPSPQAQPFDPEEFKRLTLANHPAFRADNSSSTDVSSSLSRESTISWKTETPRSSQEVHLEELRWRHPHSVFSKRSDSLVDPNAVLTEPFSPLSAVEAPWGKPSPGAPNEFCFELLADLPPPPDYDPVNSNFMAELPADLPSSIHEMPAAVPDNLEVSGGLVESKADKRNAELGVRNFQTTKQPIESPTKPSQKVTARQSTPVTRPRAVSNPKQPLGGMHPISTRSARTDRPILTELKTQLEKAATRGQNYDVYSSASAVELHRSRSSEFSNSSGSRSVASNSPGSSSIGLGKIAAHTPDGSRRTRSTSESQRTVAKSKYSQKSSTGKRTSTRRPASSIKEEPAQERKASAATLVTHATRSTEASSDEYPESPVTGSIAGPPTINKSRSIPVERRMFSSSRGTSRETSPEKAGARSNKGSYTKLEGETLTTVTNLRHEGMI